jgi:hypothetical protein
VKGKAVIAAGPKRKYETETGADGSYALPVLKGTYKVRTVGSRSVQPASHSVAAQHDVSRLDFDVCTEPQGYKGPKLGCRLVEIDGQAVDIAGKPYEHANAFVAGDTAEADAHGHFVLYAEPGTVAVDVASWAEGIHRATGSATVHATAKINTVRVTLQPRITVTQASATGVFAHIDGLPLTPGTLTFAIEHNPPIVNSTCISEQSQQITGPSNRIKSTVFEAPSGLLSQSFCKGNYNATVLSGGTTLATEPFAIPERARVGPALSGVGAERPQRVGCARWTAYFVRSRKARLASRQRASVLGGARRGDGHLGDAGAVAHARDHVLRR